MNIPKLPESISSLLLEDVERKMITIEGYDIHYLERGQGTPVFLMHGNPTWSFLYRDIIKALDPNKFRCIAPDLVGLGLSSKPKKSSFHTLANHERIMSKFHQELVKEDFIFVGQDWGGPIGLLASINSPQKMRGMVLMNTMIRAPKPGFKPTRFHKLSRKPIISDYIFRVKQYAQKNLHRVQGNPESISGAVREAYLLPFKKFSENKAPLMLARMVPNGLDHPSVAFLRKTEEFAANYKGPVALVWGKKDPILGRLGEAHTKLMPHAKLTITDGGHFIQEEYPELIAEAITEVADQHNS